MKKSEFCVLIIEDDMALGKSLERFLKEDGFKTQWARTASAAEQAMDQFQIDAIIIDCMLPDKNGLDLAVKLKKSGFDGPMILTSGIFKDPGYKNDALLKTKALEFFAKPYDLKLLGNRLNDAVANQVTDDSDLLVQTLRAKSLSKSERLAAINNNDSVHGHMLPHIYSLISQSQLTGTLKIEYENNESAELKFQKGALVSLSYPDDKSYFGVLLVEKGYCTNEQVEKVLQLNNNKRIGENLVEASFLSPHAIELVQTEQVIIRLSKSIRNEVIKLCFNECEVENDSSFKPMGEAQFSHLSHDWICSKVDIKWLFQFYTPWMTNRIEPSDKFDEIDQLLSMAVTVIPPAEYKNLIGKTIQEALDDFSENSETLLQTLHHLLIQNAFLIGTSTKTLSHYSAHKVRLSKIQERFKGQNYFEMLGLTKRAKPSEIIRAYQNLAKTYHPDKIPPNAPEDLRDISREVFAQITEAYNILNSEKGKSDYIKKLRLGEAEDILVAESQFETAYNLLKAGRLRDARKTFEQCLKLKGHRSDTYVYLTWALLIEKQNIQDSKKYSLIKMATNYMSKVSHEDRHSPPYFLARGLLYELRQEPSKARACYKSSLAIDENFSPAKKQLRLLYSKHSKPKKDSFGELSSIVTKIFKTKAS